MPEECTIPWFSLGDVWQIRDGVREYLGDTAEKISPIGIANSGARVLPAGTVVLSRTASVGFSGIMPIPMATTQDFANWVPGPRLRPEFLLHALRAMREELHRSMYGSTHNTIYMPDLRRLSIPVPPIPEQDAIVRFLRARLPQTDGLIAKKERLVALLQEKRQALITQAVTRGLDPTAPLKDSGIDWIGAIPASWSVARLRQMARLESGHTPSRQHAEYWVPSECSIPWVSLADVWQLRNGRQFSIEQTREKISPLGLANSAARVLPKDTVVLSRTASVGFSALLGADMATTQDFVGWISGPRLLPMFVLFFLRAMTPEFDRLTQGSVHRTIYMPDVARFPVVLPSVNEQETIVEHILRHLRRSDAAEDRLALQIAKLREYRQALITAAVTGLIDVTKDAAA